MSTVSGVMISGIFLSGVRSIVFTQASHVVEHQIPALEGGIVERVGSPSDRIAIYGFIYSGTDNQRLRETLQGLRGFLRQLNIPSTVPGQYFLSGEIIVDRVALSYSAGKSFAAYDYVVRAIFPASGQVYFITSGISGAVGAGGSGLITRLPSFLIDYSQVLPIFASIHPDYSQVLPVVMTIHPDYAQVLPVTVTEHPDYSQVLPLGTSIHANYVRIS